MIAFVTWVIVIINVLLRKGWVGGIGGLIGFDFLIIYAIGQIYMVIFTYLVSYPLQFITFPTGIALLALIPIVVFIAILFDCRSSFRIILMKQD